MKTKIISLISGVALIAGLAVSPAALASDSTDVTKALAGSTVLELPAKAADLVAKASAASKQNAAAAIVKAAVGVNPSAAVAIVSAVARENPATAPVAAVTAATLQHKRIDQIAKAAVAAAPSMAAKIVGALIKEFPQDYGVIAIAAAEGAPSAGREILAVVADYVPALQPAIQGATANFAANDGSVPVQAILSQSYNQALTSGAVVSTQIPSALAQSSPTLSSTTPATMVNPSLVLSQNYNQPLGSRSATTQGSSTAAQSTPIATVTPRLAPTIINAPFTTYPGSITTIGPGQMMPKQPGGRNYSSP
jgi:hypothetical protein